MSNPSTRLIKGTIFKDLFLGKISRPRLLSIRWNFVWGKKGLNLKKFSGGPILNIEIFNAFLFILKLFEVQEPR